MISRSTFRNISIMVVTSLLALTALQGAWVWRLYRDTVETRGNLTKNHA